MHVVIHEYGDNGMHTQGILRLVNGVIAQRGQRLAS